MKRQARLLFLAALLPLAAHAQGVRDGNGNVIIRDDVAASRGMDPKKPFFTYSVDPNGNYVAPGGSGGAASQTASNASDGQATSTTNQQNLVFNMLFNGTTWDRMRGTGGAVNTFITNFPASQAVTNAGTFPVQNTAPVIGGNTTAVKTDSSATTQPVSGTITANVGTTNGLALDATLTGRLGTLGQKPSTGSAPVVLASDQSTIPVNIGAPNVFVANGGGLISNTNPLAGANQAVAGSGGLQTVSRIVTAAASTNPTLAKSSAGRVYKITGYNAATTIRWLKLYNGNAAPVVGTNGVFFSLPLPPGAFSFDAQDIGYYFTSGIGFGLTQGAADGDSTALAAGDILNLNVWYQ